MIEAPATGAAAPGGGLALARRWSLIAAVVLALAVPLLLLAGPVLYRLGALSLEAAMWGLAQVALWLSLTAALAGVACIATSVIRAPKRGAIIGVAAITVALLAAPRLWLLQGQRLAIPPVNDAQTDWSRPITFGDAVMQERAGARAAPVHDDARIPEGMGPWSGKSYAEAQALYYAPEPPDPLHPKTGPQAPDELKPLTVSAPPAQAAAAARLAMQAQGWRLRTDSREGGLIEATNASPWYGLVSDIAVRVTPAGDGSRLDVRSTSRTPGPDLGANAGRIRAVLGDLAQNLRGTGQERR